MKSFHRFTSLKPPVDPASGIVGSDNWNDVHSMGAVPTTYNADGTVPGDVDFIRGVGGSGAGITLTLVPNTYTLTGPNGPTVVYQTFHAMKVDAGVGPVKFVDLNGLLLNGAATFSLTNQYQWAIFIWNGAGWDVIGN